MHIQFQSLHQVITKGVVAFTLVCIIAFFSGVGVVSAAAVSPSVVELEGIKGAAVSSVVTIVNMDVVAQTYYLDTIEFSAKEDGGSPLFISKDDNSDGFLRWIQFGSDSVTVPANSSGEVPFTVHVPSDALSGGHYAAITISSAPEDIIATNGAIVDAKTAVLLLLSVAGETVQDAALLDFADFTDRIRSKLSGEFEYRIQNQGNVHLQPQGTLVFRDLFGRNLKSVDANEGEGRVLPGSTRSYEIEVDSLVDGWIQTISEQMKVFAIGPVTAELELSYGSGEVKLVDKTTFFLLPWQLLVSLSALFALLFIVYRLGKRKS